jgi:hypothetical protein
MGKAKNTKPKVVASATNDPDELKVIKQSTLKNEKFGSVFEPH